MNDEARRPPYGWALAVTGGVFVLYCLTLAPGTALWDASEYIATAHILGIPHPPGNPLFVVLARVWSLLLSPLGLSVAVRVNLLAALTSALATGFFFLVAHRVLAGMVRPGWPALAGAAASAVLGATAYTVWNQSNVNEKVYTLSVLVIAAVSWLAVLWRDRRHEPGSDRLLLVAVYLVVLGSTNHLMSVLPLPALGLLALLSGPAFLLRGSFWARAVPLVALGLSLNLFLPIRAAERPAINEGDPLCQGAGETAVAIFSLGKAGCPALASVLVREQYQKPPVTQRMAPFSHQISNWFQYFDWQWARGVDARETPGNARLPFTLLFAMLGLLGLLAAWESDRELFVYLAALTGTLTLGLVFYLNFKYGYSLAPEVTNRDLHEVRERDYFFVAGFLVWGMLAGIGLAWAWDRVSAGLGWARAWVYTSPVLLVALIPLGVNAPWASRAGDHAARDWAYDLLMSVEPYAVLFTNGDNDTFPLWYLQEVEGIRRDVTVIVGQYLFTSWYPRQLQELTHPERQRPFRPEQAEELYADVAMPASAIIAADPQQVDQVRGGVVDRDVTVAFPTVAVTYPAGTPLDRSHRLALAIIHDSIEQRPIYFASTAGLMTELGLQRWAVRHGLVSKLLMRSLDGDQPEGLVKGSPQMAEEWFDYPRSLKLFQDVYSYRGLKSREVWSDRATLNIPWHFYALALQLADVAEKSGATRALIGQLEDEAQSFMVTARGGTKGTPGA